MVLNDDKEIRHIWFADHKITFEQHGPVQHIDWGEKDNPFYISYLLHLNMLYVGGNLGYAIFCLPKDYLKYFTGSDNDKALFYNSIVACQKGFAEFSGAVLRDNFNKWLEDALAMLPQRMPFEFIKYLDDSIKVEINGCASEKEWHKVLKRHANVLSKLDKDYREKLLGAGELPPVNIRAMYIGYAMIYEQIWKKPKRKTKKS